MTKLGTLKEVTGEYTSSATQVAYPIDEHIDDSELFFVMIIQHLA